ncbi:MAG: hypothetical protein AVDCRST_MAG89-473, partial [uncultured Gemmatimonadetes bacterium]
RHHEILGSPRPHPLRPPLHALRPRDAAGGFAPLPGAHGRDGAPALPPDGDLRAAHRRVAGGPPPEQLQRGGRREHARVRHHDGHLAHPLRAPGCEAGAAARAGPAPGLADGGCRQAPRQRAAGRAGPRVGRDAQGGQGQGDDGAPAARLSHHRLRPHPRPRPRGV